MGIFIGYQYVRFYPRSTGYPFTPVDPTSLFYRPATSIPNFNANGGTAQFTYNFTNWIAGVADIGAVNNRSVRDITTGAPLDTTVANFLFGPRVFKRFGRLIPFAEALAGVNYVTTSRRLLTEFPISTISAFPPTTVFPTTTGITEQNASIELNATRFAFVAGGGLDIKVTKNFYFRPVEVEYYLTRLPRVIGGTNIQSNIRAIAGFNFVFGAR